MWENLYCLLFRNGQLRWKIYRITMMLMFFYGVTANLVYDRPLERVSIEAALLALSSVTIFLATYLFIQYIKQAEYRKYSLISRAIYYAASHKEALAFVLPGLVFVLGIVFLLFVGGLQTGGLVLYGLLASCLLAKKAWQNFPVFTFYVLFDFGFEVVSHVMVFASQKYVVFNFILLVITQLMRFGVIYEIFTHLFRHHVALRWLASKVFVCATILLMVLALKSVYVQHSAEASNNISIFLSTVVEGILIIEVGLIMFLFLCSSAFGLRWREHIFGIALGLGTLSAVNLVVVTLQVHSISAILDFAQIIAFDFSVLIWLVYLLSPESEMNEDWTSRPQLSKWEEKLAALTHH